jgi:hypothetical protein
VGELILSRPVGLAPTRTPTLTSPTARAQVSLHSTPDDCWVSLLGKVLNLTPLIKVRVAPLAVRMSPHVTPLFLRRQSTVSTAGETPLTTTLWRAQANEGALVQPLIRNAGMDLSHW